MQFGTNYREIRNSSTDKPSINQLHLSADQNVMNISRVDKRRG